jgi:hypothetical protein
MTSTRALVFGGGFEVLVDDEGGGGAVVEDPTEVVDVDVELGLVSPAELSSIGLPSAARTSAGATGTSTSTAFPSAATR